MAAWGIVDMIQPPKMDNHKGCPYREQSMTYTLKPYPAYKPSGVGWLGDDAGSIGMIRQRSSGYSRYKKEINTQVAKLYGRMSLSENPPGCSQQEQISRMEKSRLD